MEKYPEVEKIYEDIQKLNIQGATNIAISTFEGVKTYLNLTKEVESTKLYDSIKSVAQHLANARLNEPLARNGVIYVEHNFEKEFSVLPSVSVMKQRVIELCNEYLKIISESKKSLIEKSRNSLINYDKIFTHCHSSTVEALIKNLAHDDKNFEVVCTETRPRFQGRITAKNLIDAGIKTTLITDSAADSFVINRGSVPVDIVFLGCDQIMKKGYIINKTGSWGIAMAAHYADKPVYVVTPLLKMDMESLYSDIEIEIREDYEMWVDAPKGLDMYNPAFEIVDNSLITGFVTEFGIIKPSEVEDVVVKNYPWILTKLNNK